VKGWAAATAVAASLLLAPSAARAHPQISARLLTGGGWDARGDEGRALFELGLRSEVLFGPARSGAPRLGPAVDLRTGAFETLEAAGGLAVLLPVWTGYPVVLTGAAGWASRPGEDDGAIAVATLAWGYRSYDHHDAYGFGVHLYAGARFDVEDAARWQITGGVEIDLEPLVVIPAIFVWELLTEGDPDEPP